MYLSVDFPPEIESWLHRWERRYAGEPQMPFVLSMVEEAMGKGWGGPFGAAAFSEQGALLACGVNLVLALDNPLLHAEMTCLARLFAEDVAQRRAPAAPLSGRDFVLVSSAEPCAMCAGAVNWSRPKRLIYGATRRDVERIGFDEGPKSRGWAKHLNRSGIDVNAQDSRDLAKAQLMRYRAERGKLY